MYQKELTELLDELMNTTPRDIGRFYRENEDELFTGNREFFKYMNLKLREKGLLKQDVFLKADIPQEYGYKLLREEKITKQRDTILRICYAADLSLEETQTALGIYRMASLHARDRRDDLLITCFTNRPGSVNEVNELLIEHRFLPLRESGIQE